MTCQLICKDVWFTFDDFTGETIQLNGVRPNLNQSRSVCTS